MTEDNAVEGQASYTPRVIDDFRLAGITGETILQGKEGKVIAKMFTSSLDEHFSLFASQLTLSILGRDLGSSLNSLLVIAKPDGKAYVYQEFPFSVTIIPKTPIKPYRFVFKENLADIIGVSFKDCLIDLNPEDGDKFIWLFREKWRFGLYFDLSGKLDRQSALKEMGFYYRRLFYLSNYLFLENNDNFEKMIKDGWFPFVALINNGLDKIQLYYREDKKYPSILQELVDSFNEEKLQSLVSRWWGNILFSNKKKIIMAGINSYLANTEEGYISSIKTLATEIEGIIRIDYHQNHGEKPNMNKLQKYISDKGEQRFMNLGSLCFPGKFWKYLNDYIFGAFDVQEGHLPASRHSIAHGVAKDEVYSQEFALKIILTLDNIHFFLGNQ